METLIFNSSLFILVNGRPIEDLTVSRGLGQGDSLSLFLFFFGGRGVNGYDDKGF